MRFLAPHLLQGKQEHCLLANTGESYTYNYNGNTLAPHCVRCSAGVTQRVEGGLTYNQTFHAETA